MPFAHNQAFADEVQEFYGRYHSTFRSASGQVTAHLFERDGWLIAHVSFAPGYDAATVTDPFWSELNHYAKVEGFEGKLRTLLS
jgi:hypothetical protein